MHALRAYLSRFFGELLSTIPLTISSFELLELIKKGFLGDTLHVYDIRDTQDALLEGDIPGSTKLTLDAFEELLKNYPVDNARYVFACSSGRRSLSAVIRAREAGWLNTQSLNGGIPTYHRISVSVYQ
jgi:rhodanese-related sulfurtransferase